MDNLPGVILLGTDSPISLGIIRELARHGVPVHGIGGKDSIGSVSRYLTSFSTRASTQQKLVTQLKQVSGDKAAPFIMTVSETDIAFLHQHADQLLPARPLVPDQRSFRQVASKDRAIESARLVGIRVPKTVQPVSPVFSDISDSSEWRFPVILKWADPNTVQDALGLHDLPLDKAVYCFSSDEVERYLAQFVPVGRFPLIQEYCRGVGLGHFVFMHNGEAIQTFQHLRLREWPPEGGTSTACRSLNHGSHDALMQMSIKLLRSLNWEGVAMVEYRFDDVSGDAVFMEINGRFWGSFPLAVASKANFAWLQYAVMGCGQIPHAPIPGAGRICRFMVPEARRLARILFQPDAIADPLFVRRPARELWGFVADFFKPRICYFVFQWSDPRPFLKDMANLIRKLSRR